LQAYKIALQFAKTKNPYTIAQTVKRNKQKNVCLEMLGEFDGKDG
jgi:hypothetical protein